MPIAVLGCGEAGAAIAAGLASAGAQVRAYDPLVAPPAGIRGCSSEKDAVAGADLVLSLTTAHESLTALSNALPGIGPNTIWADLNTGSPRAKTALCDAAPGVHFVDVALMAPVPGLGLRTPMIVSGERATSFASSMAAFGAQVEVLPGPVGLAASRKLLRSVFYKGLAGAAVEALAAADAAGCIDWMRTHLEAELDALNAQTLNRLVNGSRQHATRRTEEMSAATDYLRDLGVAPHMSAAARDLLASLATPSAAQNT